MLASRVTSGALKLVPSWGSSQLPGSGAMIALPGASTSTHRP